MKILKLAILAPVLLAACAKTPSSIAPVAVSSDEYAGKSCAALTTEYTSTIAKLEAAENKQKQAVAADAAGVFLVLIPPSALIGDSEADVALYKGEKIAIERALSNQGCTS